MNLLSSTSNLSTADTAEMVAARARFLKADYFTPFADAASTALGAHLSVTSRGVIVDVGAGTGWLLARLLDEMPSRVGVALDASKFATRRAASAHPRAISVVCDAWTTLPVLDDAAALVVSFFAPRNPREFRRILAPDGLLMIITPQPDHLAELVGPLGLISIDPDKGERLDAAFGEDFALLESASVTTVMRLGRQEVSDVGGMGPSAHHSTPEAVAARIATLAETIEVTASVDIRVFRRRS